MKNAETNETLLSRCWVDGTQVAIKTSDLSTALAPYANSTDGISLTQEVTTSDLFTIVTSEPLLTSFQNTTGIDNQNEVFLTEFELHQNYPNPFNPVTVISYSLPQSGIVNLKVYDLLGKKVAALVQDYQPAGKYKVEFNASSLSGGIYYYEIITSEFRQTKKMILMK